MSKLKNMAVFSAMLVGVMIYTSPAKSAVCFLPDDDGSCGGGDIEISDDSTSENQCADFNLSQNQRNSKEYDSDCYSCEPCTYNSRTTYKCALNSGATWYGGNLSVCCTNGEKYDSAEGKCCPAEGCVHNCPEGQSWNSSAKSCKCDNGKDADGGICCADSEHVSDGICCPEKKHNDGGVCKCDSQYNTDDDGNCVLPVEKNCSDINIFYMNKEQAKQCNKKAVPLNVVGSDGQCYLCGITESCDGKESKIYYIAYPPYYLKGDVTYESGCKCSSPYLVKGISSNTDPLNPGGPININAISTPGGNSSSTEKIKLPTILTGVSSSNPYSVKIDEWQCYGEEHCSAQVVKLDVFEKYAPDVAKKLKEDDNYLIDGGNFYDDFYYYTGRQFKPKSQSINTCDDYVVILGNGNPKACAQISSDYYNYHESCPKGLEKKRLPNVYDSTGAQCYECVKDTVDVRFIYSLEGTENAGHYTECVPYAGTQYCSLQWSNEMYYCRRDMFGEEYNVGDYFNYEKYFNTCKHISTWEAKLLVFGNGIDSKTWTLPYDMEMVVTYDIIYRYADNCVGCSENGGQELREHWASKEGGNSAVRLYPEIYAPRTVRMKFPQGSKANTSITKEPVDYWDGMTEDHLTIEYYVNGQKISDDSITIDDVSYSFNGSWN